MYRSVKLELDRYSVCPEDKIIALEELLKELRKQKEKWERETKKVFG